MISAKTFISSALSIAIAIGSAHPAAHAQDQPSAPAEPAEQRPLHLTDPGKFRNHAAMKMLCDLFAIKDTPEPDDRLIDLMPPGTKAINVVNPGFEFTYSEGEKPGNDYWFISFNAGQAHQIYGAARGKITDPIQGWNGTGGAGLETGRAKQWTTKPDRCTGYIFASGRPSTLHQTLKDELKPKTRYTLLVEVYKRKDFKRCEPGQMIVRLTDAKGNNLDTDTADYAIQPADPETGFAVTAITMTTTADQPPGDLVIRLGMQSRGKVRVNFDNVKLWAQPTD